LEDLFIPALLMESARAASFYLLAHWMKWAFANSFFFILFACQIQNLVLAWLGPGFALEKRTWSAVDLWEGCESDSYSTPGLPHYHDYYAEETILMVILHYGL